MGLLEKLEIISPNMLKLYSECPAKFFYKYMEQIPSPVLDKGFETGKNIHALASYYLREENIDKFEEALSAKEKELWKSLKSNIYFDYETVWTEKSIACKVSDCWIGGRLDALVKNNNEYYILDYKTGGVSEDMVYDYQTMVYLLSCDSIIKDYDGLSFIYIDLKNKREVPVKFTDKLKEDYSEKITEICHNIDKFSIKTLETCKEKTCEYSKICTSFIF